MDRRNFLSSVTSATVASSVSGDVIGSLQMIEAEKPICLAVTLTYHPDQRNMDALNHAFSEVALAFEKNYGKSLPVVFLPPGCTLDVVELPGSVQS